MWVERRCPQCCDLELTHDRIMDEYLDLVDQQSRFFRQGRPVAARALDATVHSMKMRREAALAALLGHHARDHKPTANRVCGR